MHFSSTVVRPPYESYSTYLQVTSGCSHNKCKFCTFYKDAPFHVSPEAEIQEDLSEIRRNGWRPERIFLQGADPLLLSFDKLHRIAELIQEYLPSVRSIGGYGRVDSFKNKTVAQLKKLRQVGYDLVAVGIESGDDTVLTRMGKGYQAKDIIEQLSKLTNADIQYSVIFLGGLGGYNYGLGHARKTAEVLNHLAPTRILVSGLTLFPDTPLMEEVRQGQFVEATETEKIQELMEFIRTLEIQTILDATNVSILSPVFGTLPRDKENLLTSLQGMLVQQKEEVLRFRRTHLKNH